MSEIVAQSGLSGVRGPQSQFGGIIHCGICALVIDLDTADPDLVMVRIGHPGVWDGLRCHKRCSEGRPLR